jgi:hypothetical protein
MKQTANKTTKKPDASWAHLPVHHTAVKPALDHDLPRTVGDRPVTNGRDFSHMSLNSTETSGVQTNLTQSCPFTPQRCPFGGACHTCPPRVKATQGVSIQRKAKNNDELTEVPPIVHEVLRSPGLPLDTTTRDNLEPQGRHDVNRVPFPWNITQHMPKRFVIGKPNDQLEYEADNVANQITSITAPNIETHWDYSNVRIHNDPLANESARLINAQAFTVGNHIVFGAGKYSPHTFPGKRLLAHELAHVVQQNNSAVELQRYTETTEPSSRLGEFIKDVFFGPAGRTVINIPCLNDLEKPMGEITFDRWIPHACARSVTGYLHSREWDAFGHCWIGCEGTRRCGETPTAILGTGHEISRELGFGGPHDSFRQDIRNQSIGRRLAFSSGTCFNLCDTARSSGNLDLSAPQRKCANCRTYPRSGSEGPCP